MSDLGSPQNNGPGSPSNATTTMSDIARITFCGPAKSGKSSIARVLFSKLPAHETIFIKKTVKPELRHVRHNSLVQFDVLDMPAMVNGVLDDNQVDLCCRPGTVVFVIDAQESLHYADLINYCRNAICQIHERIRQLSVAAAAEQQKSQTSSGSTVTVTNRFMSNRRVKFSDIFFDVYIHKIDGDSFPFEENRLECLHELENRLVEDLCAISLQSNLQPDSSDPPLAEGATVLTQNLAFHLTSIYDHSIFEAMSRTVQRLMSSKLPLVEKLLDMLVSNCKIEKGFLFDVVTKISLAQDSSSRNSIRSMSNQYLDPKQNPDPSILTQYQQGPSSTVKTNQSGMPEDSACFELCSDLIDVVIDVSCIYTNYNSGVSGSVTGNVVGQEGTAAAAAASPDDPLSHHQPVNIPSGPPTQQKEGTEKTAATTSNAYDSQSTALIQLGNGTLLYLKQVETFLAFVCLLKEENFDRPYLLDYNLQVFKDCLSKVGRRAGMVSN